MNLAMKYGIPMPRSAMAASPTSGHALLPASKQEMAGARNRPRDRGNQVFVGSWLDLIGRRGTHYS
jgi:hypothetical protein